MKAAAVDSSWRGGAVVIRAAGNASYDVGEAIPPPPPPPPPATTTTVIGIVIIVAEKYQR
ncbi:hypothetical protein E2C01_071872 [Portunus trituberculatus]|uniref:Uncharacterized protein n=1 Tax=Portunus trituberculatus TaxID=210409 RepID=A0A5B7I697_PORTR|nr:hypothetical protein [Portunus trituberculatus]